MWRVVRLFNFLVQRVEDEKKLLLQDVETEKDKLRVSENEKQELMENLKAEAVARKRVEQVPC
jgi:hypothetical protein